MVSRGRRPCPLESPAGGPSWPGLLATEFRFDLICRLVEGLHRQPYGSPSFLLSRVVFGKGLKIIICFDKLINSPFHRSYAGSISTFSLQPRPASPLYSVSFLNRNLAGGLPFNSGRPRSLPGESGSAGVVGSPSKPPAALSKRRTAGHLGR